MASNTPKPKAMSSRLLTMKFMQRAAASSTDPSSPDQPPAKRQKQSGDSPTSFDVDSLADKQAVQAAITKEERMRQAALDKAAEQSGDTHWELIFENQDGDELSSSKKSLKVVETGFASIDSGEAGLESVSTGSPIVNGRRSFGKFNKELERLQNPNMEESSSSDSEDEKDDEDPVSSDEDDDPTGANAMIRAARLQATEQARADRKEKRKADKAESKRLAGLRKKKEVKVNWNQEARLDRVPSSISTGNADGTKHLPNRKRSNTNDGNDRPRKSRKSS